MLAATGNERILLGFLKCLSTPVLCAQLHCARTKELLLASRKKENKPIFHKNEQIGLANAAGAGYGAMEGVSARAPSPFPFLLSASQPGIRDPLFYKLLISTLFPLCLHYDLKFLF